MKNYKKGNNVTRQSKKTLEQLFNIARALSNDVISSSDEEIINEVENEPEEMKTDGDLARNAYLKALQTVNAKAKKNSDQISNNFNLANILISGADIEMARRKITGLAAANDASLQLVASRVGLLTDDEALDVYQDLVSIGALKPDSN